MKSKSESSRHTLNGRPQFTPSMPNSRALTVAHGWPRRPGTQQRTRNRLMNRFHESPLAASCRAGWVTKNRGKFIIAKTTPERPIVKLLFCPTCFDIFKVVVAQPRSCLCGEVQGQMLDNNIARTNGRGVSFVIGNGSLVQAIARLNNLKQDKDNKFYEKQTPVLCWVRPHSGPGNPRTQIEQGGDKPIGNTVTLLNQALKYYKQEHPEPHTEPEWVVEAKKLLARMPRLNDALKNKAS